MLYGSVAKQTKDVVVLNDKNFEKLVYGSKDFWMVKFYAPWCSHCRELSGEYGRAATALKGQAKLGEVDDTANSIGDRLKI